MGAKKRMRTHRKILTIIRRILGTQMIIDMLRNSRHVQSHDEITSSTYKELWRSAAAEVIDLRRRVAELESTREHTSEYAGSLVARQE
jgi:hypothetical protein